MTVQTLKLRGDEAIELVVVETPIERIRRMQQEVFDLALEERAHLLDRLLDAAKGCAEVASIETLPAGVREALRRLGETIENDVQNIQSITLRTA